MKVYETNQIRNLGLFGHAGTGKTSFVESILFATNTITRKGTVEDNNTVSDFNEIENERGCSIFATPIYTEFKECKLNFIDTPGYDDYIGEVASTMRVIDVAAIFINAQNGIEVGADNAFDYAEKENKPIFFIINKLDLDQANFERTSNELKERYGNSVTLLQYPTNVGAAFSEIIDLVSMKQHTYNQGTENPTINDIPANEKEKAEKLRNELIESIAETDEDLMNKYFEEGTLSYEEIISGIKNAMIKRQIFPVLVASGKNNIGIIEILNFITDFCPSPAEIPPIKDVKGKDITSDPLFNTSLFIFKTVSEPQLGLMSYCKVYSGQITNGVDLINEQKNTSERINQIFLVNGKKRIEVASLKAGDIGATVKLKSTNTGDTLHDKGFEVEFPPIQYPKPKVRIAVVPKTKGEEEKVGTGLNYLHQEDPTFIIEHSQELRQIILHAQGELHLAAAKWRLEHRYKVEAEFIEPGVPYRETIQKKVQGSYRHKKQSGGAGQFAEVHMMIEPWFEGLPNPEGLTVRGKDLIKLDWGGYLEFVNCIVGGVIDQRFMPAILKGVMEKMQFGPLTGCYVRDIRVCIYDGKMHPVDSNEAAFKTAGMMVFKENFIKADPKILEPIYNVEIKAPEEYVGDVMSDLPTRRGVILGIDVEGRYQKIKARMPLAELDKYATALRSMTQARATYIAEFAEYQAVPAPIQMKLIEDYKKKQIEEQS